MAYMVAFQNATSNDVIHLNDAENPKSHSLSCRTVDHRNSQFLQQRVPLEHIREAYAHYVPQIDSHLSRNPGMMYHAQGDSFGFAERNHTSSQQSVNDQSRQQSSRDNSRNHEKSKCDSTQGAGCGNSNANPTDNRDEKDKDEDVQKDSNSGDTTDQTRKSPWPASLHRQLVEAIYEIGVSHASPAVIMEHMTFLSPCGTKMNGTSVHSINNPLRQSSEGGPGRSSTGLGFRDVVGGVSSGSRVITDSDADNQNETDSNTGNNPLTSERVKSHLQKYRKNKQKSKEEFMGQYDAWMQNASLGDGESQPLGPVRAGGYDRNRRPSGLEPGLAVLGGELAAFLTHTVMAEEEAEVKGTDSAADPATATGRSENMGSTRHPAEATIDDKESSSIPTDSNDGDQVNSRKRDRSNDFNTIETQLKFSRLAGARIPYPVLTEEERNSWLGQSMNHVIGLFYSMTNHLMKKREEEGILPTLNGTSNEEMKISTSNVLHKQQMLIGEPEGGRNMNSLTTTHHPHNESEVRQPVIDVSRNQLQQQSRQNPGEDGTSIRNQAGSVEQRSRLEHPIIGQSRTSFVGAFQEDANHNRFQGQQPYPSGTITQLNPAVNPSPHHPYEHEKYQHPPRSIPMQVHRVEYNPNQYNDEHQRYHVVNYNDQRLEDPRTSNQRHDAAVPRYTQQATQLNEQSQNRHQAAPNTYNQEMIPMSSIYDTYYSDFDPIPSHQNNSDRSNHGPSSQRN